MKPFTEFTWDPRAIAAALQISLEQVYLCFRDGRKVSFVIERRFIPLGFAPAAEGKGYDVIDSSGGLWEVRGITDKVSFAPSSMMGKGRKFDEEAFLDRLETLKGYLLADVDSFPHVPCWMVPASYVACWYIKRKLGKTASAGRKKILALLDKAHED